MMTGSDIAEITRIYEKLLEIRKLWLLNFARELEKNLNFSISDDMNAKELGDKEKRPAGKAIRKHKMRCVGGLTNIAGVCSLNRLLLTSIPT